MYKHLIPLICCLLFVFQLKAQYNNLNQIKNKKEAHVVFIKSEKQVYELDDYQVGKPINFYNDTIVNKKFIYLIANKAVAYQKTDFVNAVLRNFKEFDEEKLQFFYNDKKNKIKFNIVNDSIISLQLPAKTKNYQIQVFYNKILYGALNVEVLKPIKKKIHFISTLNSTFSEEKFIEYLNQTYKKVNIQFESEGVDYYHSKEFNSQTEYSNPSAKNDIYTTQMRLLRDQYFEKNKSSDKNSYQIFIIPSFVDKNINAYMVRNHAICFLKSNTDTLLMQSLARELARAIGSLDHFWNATSTPIGSSMNMMDTLKGVDFMAFQWTKLQASTKTYNFYDADEDVFTNNGMVAYYFWKENKNGFIELSNDFSNINRPYKKNYFSSYLNIEDWFYEIVWQKNKFVVCKLHLIVGGFLTVLWLVSLFYYSFKKNKSQNKLVRKLIKLLINIIYIMLLIISYLYILKLINQFTVYSGEIKVFKNKTTPFVIKHTLYNQKLNYENQQELKTQVLIKKEKKWYVSRHKRVLYFDVFLNQDNQLSLAKFAKSSDSIILNNNNFHEKAESHYLICNYYNVKNQQIDQKIFNHFGYDVTTKMNEPDPAKRILIFVNGYRPASLENNIKDNFADIQKNGLEFPNSSNLIYNFDRYDYWRPWNEIDLKFMARINPTESYYADGHFSVATSNHRSLLKFTQLAATYPKRCKNPKKHICALTKRSSTGFFGDQYVSTYKLLPMKSNKNGFETRQENGKIAGRNLLMMLNEIPNKSNNDTLYIVAHSMGFAYAQGIVNEVRGKINFGGYYIVSPENGEQGTVNQQEWQEVWQYGSKNNGKSNRDAACLQDGVAPQSKVTGIDKRHHIFIPSILYNRKGFYDSHFIGYYDWIFDLNTNKPGFIKQR